MLLLLILEGKDLRRSRAVHCYNVRNNFFFRTPRERGERGTPTRRIEPTSYFFLPLVGSEVGYKCYKWLLCEWPLFFFLSSVRPLQHFLFLSLRGVC